MKKAIWVMLLSGWWHSAAAQSHGGMQQYYTMQGKAAFVAMPVVYFRGSNGWYAEGRYNYEAQETVSVYGGRVFTHEGGLSFTLTPIAGVVAGRYRGGSAGINAQADYKRFSLSSQSQYTFSIRDKAEDFVYSWTDAGYRVLPSISAGISLQQTKLYGIRGSLEGGIFIEAEFKNWSVPLYVFNPAGRRQFFMLGINCEWQYAKRK